ncbi:MAG: HAMP domain-containing histidine kinase, partial [Ignavibacteriaceae bacterium]|nr:HAMP domain-containing histidine kinase [Ignavibacteriaceae bacterium]
DINTQVFYKVFLDGSLLMENSQEKFVLLKGMNSGAHILKVVPTIASGREGIPLLFPFSVLSAATVEQKPDEKIEPVSNIDYVLYGVGGIALIEFIIIIVLLSRKKGTKTVPKKIVETKIVKVKETSEPELNILKETVAKLNTQLKEKQETIDNLQNQLKEVNTNVHDLENANLNLVEQREKLKESKYKLEFLHSQKEDMFTIAIHDIKNPASAIRGYIELLNSYDLNANEQQEIMESLVATSEEIVKRSQDMCTIIANVLPEPKVTFSKHAVNKIIETVVNQNLSYSKTKHVKLVKKFGEGLPEINIDIEKIEEALNNLVNNAIKFAPPETAVEVESYYIEEKKKAVVISVKDNGVGLTEEDLRKSFQKGAVLSAKPTGLEKSSGLGLWIVKKIIDEHDGKVWVESTRGVGSTFAFEIPVE